MTTMTKETANDLFEDLTKGWSDQEKINFTLDFKKNYELRIEVLKAEQNLAKFEIEDLEENLALIEKSPLDYFNANGPWGVQKNPEHLEAERLYNELKEKYGQMVAGEDA